MTNSIDKKNNISRRKIILRGSTLIASISIFQANLFGKSKQVVQHSERAVSNSSGFITEDFLLESKAAKMLYHDYAKKLPIIDYHNHLPPADIASNKKFKNLTEIWLEGDHYKMRAMRANGIDEKYITGNAADDEKFLKWSETVPYTVMNPLYHWTHLELLKYFGIDQILNPASAREIYNTTSSLLQTDPYSTQNLLKKMNVEVLCTTDDPIDNLEHHQKAKGIAFRVLPAWRPDKVTGIENSLNFNAYINKLSTASDTNISNYQDLLSALKKRQQFFNTMGCKLSDHGMETFYAEEYTEAEINTIFQKARSGNNLSEVEISKFKSAILLQLAEMNHDLGWTQQFHVGPIRNNNSKMLKLLGPDKGYDSMGDFNVARPMSKFFDKLAQRDKLTRTIVYNVNPQFKEVMITMIGNFNDSTMPGKMQYGSAWWFLDQKKGIEEQLSSLSNMGLLGRFIGMTTDSRSFLSFPRHEYFRRILCNMIGNSVEKGELPNDMALLGKTVEAISYDNAKAYFNF
jgi:glucuronate isomerase